MRICIIDDKKKIAEFFVQHVPRIGETIYFGESTKFEVIDVIHQLAPHDINIKVRKTP